MSAEHSRAVLQLVGTALCWSLAGVLIKAVAVHWSGLAVASGRGLIAVVFLVAISRGLRFTFSPAQIVGALAYAATTLVFCVATTLTTAANAILLQYTAPIWVALLGAWFLGERATRIDWPTMAVALGGLVVFFSDSLATGHVVGDALALASGLGFAAMTIAMRRQKDGSPVESIILGNLLAGLIGLPWLIAAPPLPVTGWAALAGLGVVQLGVAYWLYVRAIRHVTALEAVLIPAIEPVLNPIWVFLAFAERPSRWALVGGAIVLAAVTFRAVVSIRTRRVIVGT